MQSAESLASRPTKAPEPGADKRSCLLVAAVKVFMADGYHASMGKIAAQARVAKQTVYNHFGSKEKLFEAVIRHIAGTLAVPLAAPSLSVREALLAFAVAIRERTLSSAGIDAYRALVAEAPRFPSLARVVYETGPLATSDALAEFLQRRMDSGELHRADPQFAAQMFMGMVTGFERNRLLYGIRSRTTALAEKRQCERIVDGFLSMLGRVSA